MRWTGAGNWHRKEQECMKSSVIRNKGFYQSKLVQKCSVKLPHKQLINTSDTSTSGEDEIFWTGQSLLQFLELS